MILNGHFKTDENTINFQNHPKGIRSRIKIVNTLQKKETITGWLFILPVIIGLSIFQYGAMIYSMYISCTKWDLLTPPKWVGIANYLDILHDKEFYQCMSNTLFFVIVMVPFGIALSMSMAIALNRQIKGCSLFRATFYMPSITSTIAISMIWLWIFNPDQGVLNTILRVIGVHNPPRWLESVIWAKPALSIVKLWQCSGYYMVIYLAGLQNIPNELYEAGDIDGANFWQKIQYITIPMLAPTTFFVTIMLMIDSFNTFEVIYAMTKGGPGGSTNTILYYIYTKAFQSYRMGYAASLSWVLFAILFTLTLIQFIVRKKREEES